MPLSIQPGLRHSHSPSAVRALKTLIKAKLDNSGDNRSGPRRRSIGNSVNNVRRGRKSILENVGQRLGPSRPGSTRRRLGGKVFRSAKIIEKQVLLSNGDSNQKRTLKLCVSVKREEGIDAIVGAPPPTSTFTIRAVDSRGVYDRPYTTSQSYLLQAADVKQRNVRDMLPMYRSKSEQHSDMIVYEFFITLVPGGKMSEALAKKKVGSRLMIKGPFVERVSRYIHTVFLSHVCSETSHIIFFISL